MTPNRLTPVALAKILNVRPQMIYGLIKHRRVGTYNNPEGKTALVDVEEVTRVLRSVNPHRAKDPTTGKPVKRTASVGVGSMLSYHGNIPGGRRRPHRAAVVTEVVLGDDGQPSLIYTTRDGEQSTVWETEDLASSIAKGKCFIESPDKLLGVLMFHWVHNGLPERAAALQVLCEQLGIEFTTIMEANEEPPAAGTEGSSLEEGNVLVTS